jgi:hypothetical protein
MPAPASVPSLASQIVADKTATLTTDNTDQQQQQELESIPNSTQDTQMMVDEESTSQSSQN